MTTPDVAGLRASHRDRAATTTLALPEIGHMVFDAV
jgi:hypothetical protein